MSKTKTPKMATSMLAAMGAFQFVASAATFIPSFVHDRVPTQFVPVWRFLTQSTGDDGLSDESICILAVISQIIIGGSELIIGGALVMAAASNGIRRRKLASFGLAYATGLFTVFLITMFAMHDKDLPKWNQYPAILAWIGVTWLVVDLTDSPRTPPLE